MTDQPLAEITELFARYEAALMTNDIATLDALFLQSPDTVRYGAGENLYGFEAIAAFRQARPGGSPPRTVLRTAIACFGPDLATTHIEFQRPNSTRIGRQSQTWHRTEAGWKIVAAHVSFMAEGS